MIHSMTGYAAASREFPFGTLSIELRSVNHRYLDVQFRLPDDLRAVEPVLRGRLAENVNRGKVECRVSFSATHSAGKQFKLNEPLLLQLEEVELKVRSMLAGAGQLSAAEVLRWPGILATEPLPLEALQAACRDLLANVIAEFNEARAREGAKLSDVLLDRAAGMERIVLEIAPRISQVVTAYQEKITARLREAMGGGDEDRIRQEVALFAARTDVDEELSRLTAHLTEMKRMLAAGGIVGKKLDFLLQELNREANTLSSKSLDLAMTRAALDMKLLIEQMREQVQNIE